MLLDKKKQLLFINMEYTQSEVNEPINVDVISQNIPSDLFDSSNIKIIYRDLGDLTNISIDFFDIILISTKVSSYNELEKILNLSKEKIVIVGGIVAICAYEELAKTFKNIIVNTGEAETNIRDLIYLAYMANSVSEFKYSIKKNDIKNVCFFEEDTNCVYCSKRMVCDLTIQDSPIHNRIDYIINRNGLVRMETSRGCPWNKCSFCIMPWKFCGEKWRAFSDCKIEEEMLQLINKGAKKLFFTDEDFIGNYDHIIDLCTIIRKCTNDKDNTIVFGGSTSVFTLLNLGEKLDFCLDKMYTAGIRYIFLGVESGCDEQLKRYNKGVTANMNELVIKKLQCYDFDIDFGFIMFDADTTMDELEENLIFLNRTGLRYSVSRYTKKLRITPHTVFFDEYKSRNILTSTLNIDELFYDFKFCDPNIEIVYNYIAKLDNLILKEAYYLQSIIRSSTQKNTETIHKRLQTLREYGFMFLTDCVCLYKNNNQFADDDIKCLFSNYIERLRFNGNGNK